MIKELATVLSQESIAAGIYSLVLRVSFAEEVLPGQFVSLYSRDASRLLPRPISICESSSEEGTIRLVYRIAGAGTSEFSKLIAGEKIEVLGPLGNGFPVKEYAESRVLLAVGYRSEPYLLADLESEADVHVATEDGSLGTPGNVIDAIKADDVKADVIFSCGPKPMLRALKAYAAEIGIPCYVSMEERMACGIGACLACVCRTTGIDGHSHVHNTRICKDGPVFLAEEVDLT